MPSTYTTNLGIEKIATGEQSGTWGVTTNTNFDLIDQAVNGIVSVTLASAGSSGSPNALEITDGSASDGRNKFIEFVDGGDLGGTAFVQLTPNDAEKIVIIRNSLSGDQSVIVFQGTYNASNDFEVENGKDVVLKFDGAGTGATVTQVFDDLLVGALSTTTVTATTGNITTVNATTVDATNVEATNLKAKDGTAAITVADSTGQVTIADAVLTTADINGGNIDGTAIGTSTPSTANISTLSLGGVQVTSNAGEINLLDGSVAGTIVNSKGVVYGSSGEVNATTLQIGGSSITASAAEINQLSGVTSSVLESDDIGSTVQGYDANTAKLDAATANFTGTLQNGGSNVVVDTDIGSTVQAFDANTAKLDAATANFTGTLQNGGSDVVVDTDIGSTVLAYDANLQGFVDAFALPTSDGSADQVLKTDGSGNIGFTTVSSGISTGKAIAMAIVFG